ncbi:hypothetical protein ACLOJK_020953 [Asimina triloba]
MVSLRRLMLQQHLHSLSSTTKAAIFPSYLLPKRHQPDVLLPSNPHFQRPSLRFLDIYQMANKEALAKERARMYVSTFDSTDEMNRGYFADISEMKKHGGKVSLIDSWFLSLALVKKLLLRTMRKSNPDGSSDTLQRQIVYSFGDHYYFRKELKILNLLTGYAFLLDRFGRIRWQGFGLATPEEPFNLYGPSYHYHALVLVEPPVIVELSSDASKVVGNSPSTYFRHYQIQSRRSGFQPPSAKPGPSQVRQIVQWHQEGSTADLNALLGVCGWKNRIFG